jgi:hypothetical protein
MEILNINLVNQLGQQLLTWIIKTDDQQSISLPLQLPSGVYIVIVETKKGKINKKIIIN